MIVIKGQYISKNESIIIKSIAVMLMVFHHLFGFPERINSDYIIISDFSFCTLALFFLTSVGYVLEYLLLISATVCIKN